LSSTRGETSPLRVRYALGMEANIAFVAGLLSDPSRPAMSGPA
jgi:hypothetical protein